MFQYDPSKPLFGDFKYAEKKKFAKGIAIEFTQSRLSIYKDSKVSSVYIPKTCPCNIQRFLNLQKKMKNFQQKKIEIFNFFTQNIDYGYMLELPRRGSSNEYPQSVLDQK